MQAQIKRDALLTEQTVNEVKRMRILLEESETGRIRMLQDIDSKERENVTLKAIVKRLAGIIRAHREAFGEMADMNYDLMMKEISNINL